MIPPSERAPGGMLIPDLAVPRNSGLTLHLAFFTWAPPNFGPWTAVSTPSLPIVIR